MLLLSGMLQRSGCNGRSAAEPPQSEREGFMCDFGLTDENMPVLKTLGIVDARGMLPHSLQPERIDP